MGKGALDFDFKKRDLVVAGEEIQEAVRSGRSRPSDGRAVTGRRHRGHAFFSWVSELCSLSRTVFAVLLDFWFVGMFIGMGFWLIVSSEVFLKGSPPAPCRSMAMCVWTLGKFLGA